MKPKILIVYPNLPLMMSPAISVAIINAICKREKCDVKLFETTQYSDEYDNKHIRLAEIGAVRANKDDEVKDMFHIKPTQRIIPDFTECVSEYKPDLILMSVQEDVFCIAIELLESIKDLHIKHILGGILPISDPSFVIEHDLVNQICIYEGEGVVTDAISCLKNNKSISNVKGTWFKDFTGKIHKNPPQPLANIMKVIPDFSCFEGMRWKRTMGGRIFDRAVSMETYRGCPYNCTYCNSPNTRDVSKVLNIGNYMRRKTADRIEEEFLFLKESYDPDLMMFQDDSFLARPAKEIFDFCKMWSKYKVPFWMNTRIENCKPEYLEALKEAGCYRMSLGIESGNANYRIKVLKRPASNKKYEEFLGYINESNIPYALNVIIGMPFETREMVLETADMVRNARGYDGITIAIFQPYRGTTLRKVAVENGFLDSSYVNGENSSNIGGGFMDTWPLKMPEPYLQEKDVKGLIKCFSLYAHFNHDMWPEIKVAETDDTKFKELIDLYKGDFFEDFQQGGKDRIQKFCAMHDFSSTYQFEVA